MNICNMQWKNFQRRVDFKEILKRFFSVMKSKEQSSFVTNLNCERMRYVT